MRQLELVSAYGQVQLMGGSFEIVSADGFGGPPVARIETQLFSSDGARDYGYKVTQRRIILAIQIDDIGGAENRRDELSLVLDPAAGELLLIVTRNDGSQRQITGYVDGAVSMPVSTSGLDLNTSQRVIVPLICPWPFWESSTELSADWEAPDVNDWWLKIPTTYLFQSSGVETTSKQTFPITPASEEQYDNWTIVARLDATAMVDPGTFTLAALHTSQWPDGFDRSFLNLQFPSPGATIHYLDLANRLSNAQWGGFPDLGRYVVNVVWRTSPGLSPIPPNAPYLASCWVEEVLGAPGVRKWNLPYNGSGADGYYLPTTIFADPNGAAGGKFLTYAVWHDWISDANIVTLLSNLNAQFGGVGTGFNVEITSGRDVFPVIEVTGGYNDPIITNHRLGLVLKCGFDVPLGQTWTIDLRPGIKTAFDASGNPQPFLAGSDVSSWRLAPGANDIGVTFSGTSGAAAVRFLYRPSFASA